MKKKIKKGICVKVLTGKDKGKIGKIKYVFKNKDYVLIDNVKLIKKHKKKMINDTIYGIIFTESKIHISNISIIS